MVKALLKRRFYRNVSQFRNCKHLVCIYLSGPKGRDYLDVSLFEKKGIKVEFQDFRHPVYKQRYEGFIPNMAAIDALLNVGKIPE